MRRVILLMFGPMMSLAAATALAGGSGITLGRDRINVGAKRLTLFVTSRADAIRAVSAQLGKPLATGSHGDCGQRDVIGYAKYRSGFELSFIRGKLSGWTEDSGSLATDRGVRVGSTVADLRKAYPDVFIDPGDEANGGVGPNFQSEIGPAGWSDGARSFSKVTGLFAGKTCLAGI